jgi:hypothetical protein
MRLALKQDRWNVRRLVFGALVALAITGLVACGRAEVTEEERGFESPTPSGAPGGPLGQPTETPAAGLPAPAPGEEGMETVEVELTAQNDSGQDGTATLEADGDKTVVKIEIKPGAGGGAQAAHIHKGTCDALGEIEFPLEDVENGLSESTIDVKLSDLMAGDERAINVHVDDKDDADSVSCGELETEGMAPAGGTPGSGTPPAGRNY